MSSAIEIAASISNVKRVIGHLHIGLHNRARVLGRVGQPSFRNALCAFAMMRKTSRTDCELAQHREYEEWELKWRYPSPEVAVIEDRR